MTKWTLNVDGWTVTLQDMPSPASDGPVDGAMWVMAAREDGSTVGFDGETGFVAWSEEEALSGVAAAREGRFAAWSDAR